MEIMLGQAVVAGAAAPLSMLSVLGDSQTSLAGVSGRKVMLSLGVGLAGSVVGALLWKDHRVLGFLGGGSAAGAVVALAHKRFALAADVAIPAAAAVAGSYYWQKRYPQHGNLGGVAGYVLAGAAARIATNLTPLGDQDVTELWRD